MAPSQRTHVFIGLYMQGFSIKILLETIRTRALIFGIKHHGQ